MSSPEERYPTPELASCTRIETLGESVLQLPDYTKYLSDTLVVAGPPYSIRVTHAVYDGSVPEHTEAVSRRMFVNDTFSHQCLFSIDIRELEENGRYKGRYPDSNSLASFLRCIILQPEGEIWKPVKLAHDIALASDAERLAGDEDVSLLTAFLDKHIGDGATQIQKQLMYKFDDDTHINIVQRKYEGDAERHLGFLYKGVPALRIRLRLADKAVVLEKDNEGTYETSIEDRSMKKELVSYANPKNIFRDCEGEVIAFSLQGDNKEAIREAERAIGVRGLHSELLAQIETALLKLPN